MKKIKNLVIILVIALMMPLSVKADMGAPSITSYTAVISNTEGAQTYDYDGVKTNAIIPYDKKVTIILEITINNEDYVELDNNDSNVYIKMSDINSLSEVDFEKISKNERQNEYKLYVYKDGAKLYNGPSKAYGEVKDGSIPVGTTLKYTYEDEMWAYVEYKGKKGWIYTYSITDEGPYKNFTTSVCIEHDSSLIVINDNIKLYSSPSEKTDYTTLSVPRNTIIKYNKLLQTNPDSSFIFIEYQGKSGWIYNEEESKDIATEDFYGDSNSLNIITNRDTKLLETPNEEKEVTALNVNTIISQEKKYTYRKYIYTNDIEFADNIELYYYVEYEGKKGWVKENDSAIRQKEQSIAVIDLDLKDIINGKVINTIEKGTKIDSTYYYNDGNDIYYYVESNNKKGWLKSYNNIAFSEDSKCLQYLVINENGIEATSAKDELLIDIPPMTMLTGLYYYEENESQNIYTKFYVKYQDDYYWITYNSRDLAERGSNSRYKFIKNEKYDDKMQVYSDFLLTKELFTIDLNETFDELFYYNSNGSKKAYINYRGQKGWINKNYDILENIAVENDECLLENLETKDKIDETTGPTTKTTSKKKLNINSRNIIIGIIIAITLSLSSLLTIILINKKKKQTTTENTNNIEKD